MEPLQTIYTGLGFRREFAQELLDDSKFQPAFLEVAPENWMNIGGYWKSIFEKAVERFDIKLHGLSLSLGGPDELDMNFLNDLKSFMRRYNLSFYSEHLSFTKCANAHLYDLLPVPFTMDAVLHVSDRISQVQDFLGIPISIENVSYYATMSPEMSESEFISEIVKRSGCRLLLDVNNVYVNSVNHAYSAREFISSLPAAAVACMHMAGHKQVEADFIIDTHGESIISPVYELLEYTLEMLPKPVPVLLERDYNIPDLAELGQELAAIDAICFKRFGRQDAVA